MPKKVLKGNNTYNHVDNIKKLDRIIIRAQFGNGIITTLIPIHLSPHEFRVWSELEKME